MRPHYKLDDRYTIERDLNALRFFSRYAMMHAELTHGRPETGFFTKIIRRS
ncbi:MAG: hypothetical protein MUE44_31675 [Oscillatoriaceae cyanobacterium Prado104]|nr:hypothetical protein [Oscillatoriaceae cyanobacterium Prado104]